MLAFPHFCCCLPKTAAEAIDQALKRFIEVFATVEAEAADPINPASAIYEGAIPGMLRRLDPHQRLLRSRPVRAAEGTREIDAQGFRQRRLDSARHE